jgi:RNA polymerase II subunit A C-terminal domain phosphatase SSU72
MSSSTMTSSAVSPQQRPIGAPLHRPVTPTGIPPLSAYRGIDHGSVLSFGVVCSSNINRSMEAHLVLNNAGLRCASYGTGTQVRLPGRTAMEPKIFKFGTPYYEMYNQLSSTVEDGMYFYKNGVLQLCQRGAAVKTSPTRWQDCMTVNEHQVVICFEERIYDAVIEDIQNREPTNDFHEMHIICLDTKDNPTEAAVSGQVCLDLCWRLEQCHETLSTDAAMIIDQFQQERASVTPIKVLYQLCYL